MAFVGFAHADFYIYADVQNIPDDSGMGVRQDGFKFFNSPPSCEDVTNAMFQNEADDVSGNRSGVRCDECGFGDSAEGESAPTEIEWNTDMGHYTWYAARDNHMVDLDGNVVGTCNVDDSDSYICGEPPIGTRDQGRSQIFCESDLTAS
ncbi:hypothetical protein AB5N19_12482 [Seiridium cardinale]